MLTFFDLIDEQQADILVSWLCINDVINLDSAVCNRAIRPDFLALLQSKCVFAELDTFNDPINWAVRNKLVFRNAIIKHYDCTEETMQAIGSSLDSLQVVFYRIDDDDDGIIYQRSHVDDRVDNMRSCNLP